MAKRIYSSLAVQGTGIVRSLWTKTALSMTSPGVRTQRNLGSFMDVRALAFFEKRVVNLHLDMPAKTVIFDQRVHKLHDFGSSPHNFISFNPQGRLLLLAGFGNLAGKIDIFDRRSLTKVTTIDAPNTSHCEWSADGRFLLTATLSPRLRVDNGIKIWHCSGVLVYVKLIEELYQVSWRPTPPENAPPFPNQIPAPPEATDSVKEWEKTQKKPAVGVSTGAYRPPGARGLATPAIFKREDEGGFPSNNGSPAGSGANTPVKGYNRGALPPGAPGYGHYAINDGGYGKRHVPGAPPPGLSAGGDNERKGNKKKKGTKRQDASEGGPGEGELVNGNVNGKGKKGQQPPQDAAPSQPPEPEPSSPVTPAGDGLDANVRRVRNLNKKV